MKTTSNNLRPRKNVLSRPIGILLLMVCLCVLVLRAMYTESPNTPTLNANQVLSNSTLSLLISTALFLSALLWVIVSIFQKKTFYRFSGIEAGLTIFFIAAMVSLVVAANKRAAITDAVTLLAPILMAVLLVQILDTPGKIRLLLIITVALGAASTYQCVDQIRTGNRDLIKSYEENPSVQLKILGIGENTFEHFLFEHRLYSSDIRGFLTTSNSTGSFLILSAFAGVGLFIEKLKNRRNTSSLVPLICCALVTVVVIAGLLLTRSKGAIGAAALGVFMLVCCLGFGKQLYHRRLVILVLLILLVSASAAGAIWYGVSHGRLPGGNSMLVRWQYWQSAARMYADKPLTGVGAGNFAGYYTHYKPGSALETVMDPHNFILSLLTQYGPLGLIGFLAALLVPLYKTVFSRSEPNLQNFQAAPGDKHLAGVSLVFILVTLLLFRPMFMADELGDDPAVIFWVVLILYVVPVCVFIVAFRFLWSSQKKMFQQAQTVSPLVQASVFCGIVAVLIANLIDFAIFEPGVSTLFWMMLASLISIDRQTKKSKTIVLIPPITAKIAVAAVCAAIVVVYFYYALVPPIKTGAKLQQAGRNLISAHGLLALAAQDDPLDPSPLHMNGKVYLQNYNNTGKVQPELLKEAHSCFVDASVRNEADYKNFAKLTTVYNLLAETSGDTRHSDWIRKAFEAAQHAVERYPGSGELHLELGKTAEKLGKTETALLEYDRAVEIEQSYQKQFLQMYPGWETVSRIGWENLQFAKERIEVLSK